MNENRFYVYKHIFPNDKVYIGITSQKPASRWGVNGVGYERQPRINNAINKYGWDNVKHEILYSNLTHDEACEKEVELIAKYNSTKKDFGYNMTNGGECLCGEDNPFYGKTHSPAVRKKLSELKKGVSLKKETIEKIRKANIGKKRDEKFKLKMKKIGEKNKKVGSASVFARRIYQIDLDTNEIIREWGSIKEAADYYNIKYVSICCACRGKTKSSVGFKWQYVDEPHEFVEHKPHYKTICVDKYTRDGIFVGKFESVKQAAKSVGKNETSAISAVCKGKKKTAYGYIWKYGDKDV